MLETKYKKELGRSITRLGLGTFTHGASSTQTHARGRLRSRSKKANGITHRYTPIKGTYEHIARGLREEKRERYRSRRRPMPGKNKFDGAGAPRESIERARWGQNRCHCCSHCARNPFTEELWGLNFGDAYFCARKWDRRDQSASAPTREKASGMRGRHREIDVIHPLINIKGMGIINGNPQRNARSHRQSTLGGQVHICSGVTRRREFRPQSAKRHCDLF